MPKVSERTLFIAKREVYINLTTYMYRSLGDLLNGSTVVLIGWFV